MCEVNEEENKTSNGNRVGMNGGGWTNSTSAQSQDIISFLSESSARLANCKTYASSFQYSICQGRRRINRSNQKLFIWSNYGARRAESTTCTKFSPKMFCHMIILWELSSITKWLHVFLQFPNLTWSTCTDKLAIIGWDIQLSILCLYAKWPSLLLCYKEGFNVTKTRRIYQIPIPKFYLSSCNSGTGLTVSRRQYP